jgi:hypothetical protein
MRCAVVLGWSESTDKHGTANVGLSDDSLTLTPDPVLRINGTKEVEAVYVRDVTTR